MILRRVLKVIFVIVLVVSCTDGSDELTLEGRWRAKWKTTPESFQGIQGITSFEMDGFFIFEEDSLTVIANGFPGCVFGVDTIQHTQLWKFSNDSLHLINENNVQGISYKVDEVLGDEVRMRLMEDIFVTLSK